MLDGSRLQDARSIAKANHGAARAAKRLTFDNWAIGVGLLRARGSANRAGGRLPALLVTSVCQKTMHDAPTRSAMNAARSVKVYQYSNSL